MSLSTLIKKPLITEKSVDLSKEGKYVFIVEPRASKSEIKKAVKKYYGVDAVAVHIVNAPGKPKRFKNIRKITPGTKKAIVTLKSGQSIDVVPQ